MTQPAPEKIHLSDYTPPAYLIDKTELTFRLSSGATRVLSRITFRPNPECTKPAFFLHGEGLTLISARIDGAICTPNVTATGLTADVPDAPFIWEAEVEIAPDSNTALEGLYMSSGLYTTQCEAEGFRKITYYPDRPDVMARFDVRIECDAPVLLSNGNPVDAGDGWAEWSDPWPKPAYLFALVAGNLTAYSDSFTTMSGRPVELNIWVRDGDQDKCAYAMDALKRSMIWDEETYGREYDLSVFNIVAVDDFNAGAMENKGLNIFNSKYVLASPQTATDRTYELIEGVIAHEYFHNWTGNRITCRDWFQLSLKEGLTVFRDQQFSADMRSAAVKRIDDVIGLRAAQFREDSGPLAHNVRPESFVEINNFYTATVYEKGAEIIGMLKTLVGDADYAKALDLYFERHDGDAATVEDWLTVFQDVTGRDLSQFKRWYTQAGTPRIDVSEEYADGTYSLTLTQHTPPTPGQPDKAPQVIPVAVGLLNPNGDEVRPTTVLELTETQQTFRFDGLGSKPVPSILRGFSAPVIINRETSNAERSFLLANDTDTFNKWEAGRALAKSVLNGMITRGCPPDSEYLDTMASVIGNDGLDPAFRARVLQLPSDDDMAQTLSDSNLIPDPDAIYAARQDLTLALAENMRPLLSAQFEKMATSTAYSPDADAAAKRSLRGALLALTTRLDGGKLAQQQFYTADNMTEQFGAFQQLIPTEFSPKAAHDFYQQWKNERLVIDMWFAAQVGQAKPKNALIVAETLSRHPDFNWKNPNRLLSVLRPLAMENPAGFHRIDGRAYRFLADWVIKLDPVNASVAARAVSAFATWRRYDQDRKDQMKAELLRIKNTPDLSGDTLEMVSRLLGDD